MDEMFNIILVLIFCTILLTFIMIVMMESEPQVEENMITLLIKWLLEPVV